MTDREPNLLKDFILAVCEAHVLGPTGMTERVGGKYRTVVLREDKPFSTPQGAGYHMYTQKQVVCEVRAAGVFFGMRRRVSHSIPGERGTPKIEWRDWQDLDDHAVRVEWRDLLTSLQEIGYTLRDMLDD